MAPTQFKLTKRDGPTRRANFNTAPGWVLLSSKIASLFDIPSERVGVSYIDAEGDEITVSSNEELNDYYAALSASGNPVIPRLTVLDLGSVRVTTETTPKPQPKQPTASQQPPFRNTFGGADVFPLVFEVEDEWQNLPKDLGSLFLRKGAPDSPHAFVEVLDSDASRFSEDEPQDGSTIRSHSPALASAVGKGKGKAREDFQPKVEDDDASSTDSVSGSVFDDQMSPKPPVHVFDVSNVDIFEKADESAAQDGVATPAQAQSTPVFSEQTLKDVHLTNAKEPTTLETEDPPLPTIDPIVPPSLTHDVATLLNNFSNVIASHPELGEGIRRLVSNAASGTYWAAHREAISRAAENIQRTAAAEAGRTIEELRRTAEQEAGGRVAEALGRVFRTFSDGAPTHEGGETQRADGNNIEASNIGEQAHTTAGDSGAQFVPDPPNHHRGHRGSWFGGPNYHRHHHPRFGPFWGPYAPPPPPPPPPISIPTIPPGPRSWPRPPPHRFWGRNDLRPEPRPVVHVKASSVNHTPIPVPVPVVAPSPVIPEHSPAGVHIVSNARGPYPQLEMFEVPRRSLTVGHTGRQHIPVEIREQVLSRIMRKLSDMGFTAGSHPNLHQKVTDQLIAHPPTSRDVEDDIVTNLIEELIPTTSNQPRAGPSRDSGIPGAWH
ncbi:hypothetical protein BKA82DRAFT_3969553 [Pisolithus tinctorius]|nr:hypothetical protein BKA82DRAFT_3969553 [Pisolithus tinctorius]